MMKDASARERLKREAWARIDSHAEQIMRIGEDIMKHPETGFREARTASIVARELEALGAAPQTGLAITGVKGKLTGGSSRRTVAVMGEMDSLLSEGHVYADPETGAAHTCGHNAGVAAMIGVGIGLQPLMSQLDGDVVLLAVPAEECIELDWRLQQRDEGRLEFIVGKAELIRIGAFDDVDMALISHTFGPAQGTDMWVAGTTNGSVTLRARFHGRQAHAGAAPWDGIDAYKAMTLALSAIDAQRDTFKDEDQVRVHYLVTRTGDAMTSVPSLAQVEIMVRAASGDGLHDAVAKVKRSLEAGAVALGARLELDVAGGYLPMACEPALIDVTLANANEVLGAERVESSWGAMSGSSDTGDVGHLMPVVHPMVPAGKDDLPHSSTYHVVDHALASVNPAKVFAATIIDLLLDGAAGADAVLRQAGPKWTKEQYLAERRRLES